MDVLIFFVVLVVIFLAYIFGFKHGFFSGASKATREEMQEFFKRKHKEQMNEYDRKEKK